jgi:alpha-N-arabinofuranosidase
MRRDHGFPDPHNVRLWCLGNEMDGPWQTGHKTATEYGRLARETAAAMRSYDRDLELVACGSSHAGMPTYPDWEATVLDHCYDQVDYISLHTYYGNSEEDLGGFLARPVGMDRYIDTVVSVCDVIQSKKRSPKRLRLSFDEWNVWFHSRASDRKQEPWGVAPPILEDVYTMEDALVAGSMLNSLIRHADRVKIACLAQLVNVIAPIMTETGGPVWRQTIYYPFLHASLYGRGASLQVKTESPCYETEEHPKVPYLDATVTWDQAAGTATLFAVNRSEDDRIDLEAYLGGLDGYGVVEHITLNHDDHKATNTKDDPENVSPATEAGAAVSGAALTATLAPLSWNVIRMAKNG